MEFITCQIKKIKMVNGLSSRGAVQIENSTELVIEHEWDNGLTEVVLKTCVKHKNPSQFCIELELEGIFRRDEINDAVSKRKTHMICYDTLFPYANQIMTFLATNSGLQGFMLQKQEIEPVNFDSNSNDDDIGRIIELRYDDFGK